MHYSKAQRISSHMEMTDVFLGYNHNLRNRNGEFYDEQNMSAKLFPVMAPREPRGTAKEITDPQGLIAKGALCYVDGSMIVVDGTEVEMGLSTAPEDCPKTLTGMGAYVIIMPDKMYINTIDITDRGNIENYFTSAGEVTYTLSTLAGAPITATVAAVAPEAPENGAYWIDTSQENHSLKRYSAALKTWVAQATCYVKISSPGIGAGFKKGDAVNISGVTVPELQDLNAVMTIWEMADDWILVVGLPDNVATQTEPIRVERRMPKVDFLTESKNRLWGCRYGTNNDGEIVNEIYASAQGDPRNWQIFRGTAMDSYIVSIGSDGPWTGAVTLKGCPVFYKETVKHKVFGDYPAAYGVVSNECRGVGLGNGRSIAVVNETAIYMSSTGVCMDDGSLPVEISVPLGEKRYQNGVAGAFGNLYVLSCQDFDSHWHFFTYDTAKRMWHREDDTQAMGIQAYHGDLYWIDANTKKLRTMLGTGIRDTDQVHWMAETGLIAADTPGSKYISKIDVRMSMDVGSKVRISCQYDSIGDWYSVAFLSGTTLRTFISTIRPRRCDHLRIRFEGTGPVRIYSVTKNIEGGSY